MNRWVRVALVVGLSLIVGFVLPRLLIEPNLDIVDSKEAAACVSQAYLAASTMVSGSAEVYINTGLRVMDVEPISSPSAADCPCPYRVTIQAYTWFAIPYDQFVVECWDVRRVSSRR